MTWTKKTFRDLKFKQKTKIENPTARIDDFGNGYGIEVESHLMGYDVTILKHGKMYTKTHITDTIIKRLTSEEVAAVMEKLQLIVRFSY